jgi:hypothetical protein
MRIVIIGVNTAGLENSKYLDGGILAWPDLPRGASNSSET